MPGRPCGICSSSDKMRRAAELVAAGATDEAVGAQLGVSRAAAQRHRTLHVVAPAKALVEAAGKGQDVRARRFSLQRKLEIRQHSSHWPAS